MKMKTWRKRDDVEVRELGGELVVVDLAAEAKVFVVSQPIGAVIFRALATGTTRGTLVDLVRRARKHDIARPEDERHVDDFIEALAAASLVRDGTDAGAAIETPLGSFDDAPTLTQLN